MYICLFFLYICLWQEIFEGNDTVQRIRRDCLLKSHCSCSHDYCIFFLRSSSSRHIHWVETESLASATPLRGKRPSNEYGTDEIACCNSFLTGIKNAHVPFDCTSFGLPLLIQTSQLVPEASLEAAFCVSILQIERYIDANFLKHGSFWLVLLNPEILMLRIAASGVQIQNIRKSSWLPLAGRTRTRPNPEAIPLDSECPHSWWNMKSLKRPEKFDTSYLKRCAANLGINPPTLALVWCNTGRTTNSSRNKTARQFLPRLSWCKVSWLLSLQLSSSSSIHLLLLPKTTPGARIPTQWIGHGVCILHV